jgi:predicted TPR repeat methyltransferase
MVHSSRPTPPAGFVDRRAFLPAQAAGRSVVHLGCVDEGLTRDRAGTGELLHEELTKVSSSLVGVDISEDGLRDLSALVPGAYLLGDVLDLSGLPLPERCDLVIAAELIEHLRAPSVFLEELRDYLERSGAVGLLSTPNAYSWIHWWRFALTRREDVHPDHLLLYSPATLQRALAAAGLRATRVWMHRWPRSGWRRAPSRMLDRVVLAWNPHLAIGFVVEVVPAN